MIWALISKPDSTHSTSVLHGPTLKGGGGARPDTLMMGVYFENTGSGLGREQDHVQSACARIFMAYALT